MEAKQKTKVVDYRKAGMANAENVKTCPKCKKRGKWFRLPAGGSLVGHVVIEYERGSSSVDLGCKVDQVHDA